MILRLFIMLWLVASPCLAVDGIDFAVFQANTSASPQDITISGIGTPAAVLFFMSRADQEIGVNIEDHGLFVVGAYDGTRQSSARITSDDAAGTTDARRWQNMTQCLHIMDRTDGTSDGQATCSFITDGVRLGWSDFPSFAHYGVAIFFYGDITAYTGTFTMTNTLSSVVDVTAPGFEPHHVILWSIGTTATTDTAEAWMSLGFADSSGSQGAFGHSDRNNQSTSLVSGATTQTYAIQIVDMDVIEHACSLQTDASGFDCTVGVVGNSVTDTTVHYLALRYDTASHYAGVVDAPASAGLLTHSAPNFQPTFVMTVPTNNTVFDTLATSTGGVGFLGVCPVLASKLGCFGTMAEDATSLVSNTASIYDEGVALACFEDNQSLAYWATFDSMASTGPRLNYQSTKSGAKILMLAVGGGGGGPSPVSEGRGRPLFFNQ